ncbi:MAG TPA: cell division protein FtsA [Patescibacteria group bacterium]|nr:cell division protein FtsA [Patescibacteria group bacterium]
MFASNYICALDIGSSKISAAVAQMKKKHITNLFFESGPSKGFRNGSITDALELIGCVGAVLKNLARKSGIPIKFVYTTISGQDITTKHSPAIIPLAERGNKVITPSDVLQANEQARILGSSLEEEIIHQIPFGYVIDSKNEILNPIGLYGHRLKVDLYLICGKLSSIQSIIRIVNQAGFEVKDIFFSGLATSEAVCNRELRQGINVLCDIGNDMTELLVFKEGLLRSVEILPIGGYDVTAALADSLKIPPELAEEVKQSYGVIDDSGAIREDKEILLKKNNIYHTVKQKMVVEIATAKAKQICQAIKERLEKMVNLYEVDNVVTVGRTVLLEGLLENLEGTLGVSVRLGRIVYPEVVSVITKDNALSGQKYVNHISSIGIICQVLKKQQPLSLSATQPAPTLVHRVINKAKEVYQEYF